MAKIKWYLCSGIGVNIYTGRNEQFYEEVSGELRFLQSRISYKRDQGFKGTVYVRFFEINDESSKRMYKNFRIYDVPFRGIGRITFQKWGEKE